MKSAIADHRAASPPSACRTAAPSRKSGKNWARNPRRAAHERLRPMRQQRLARERARRQCAAAARAEYAPAFERQPDQEAEPNQNSDEADRSGRPIGQTLREQDVEIGVERLPTSSPCCSQEALGAAPPLSLQQREKCPLCDRASTTRRTRQAFGHDPVRAHLGPSCALADRRIGDLAQNRDHAQFLHQRRVE